MDHLQYSELTETIQCSDFYYTVKYRSLYVRDSPRGINSIDVGQIEGAKALGMGYVPMMIYIILPQTFKIIAPQIGNTFVANTKILPY